MANLIPIIAVFGLVLLGFASTSSATTYNVGDTSGWDISTDLNTWSQDKKFNVGDVLSFQYSSSNSVSEVTKESFESCNTSKVIKSYSGGNTNVTLSRPGDWYFVSGNKLYCLGGMKLKAEVESNQDYAPAGAPQATNGQDLPQPSSKSNIPSSAALMNSGPNALILTIFGLAAALYVSM